MEFSTIDMLAKILLAPNERTLLDLEKLNTLSTLTITPVSAMGNTTHLYQDVKLHHGLDLLIFQNYYYNKQGKIIHQSEMTIRVNDSFDLTPEDKDWYTMLANTIHTNLQYKTISPFVEFNAKKSY